jgi:YrbI family 3-deoxy-D-manno-octulosonate 8-phosphate phosphatase
MSGPGSRVLAIIPARGGSRGIPRKNVAPLGGKPLLAWSIESARSTPEINRIVVSTDDVEIAATARAWGAEVVERPASISGDEASSESALLQVLEALRVREGYEPDLVVFLQATSPLRRTGDISRAIATLRAAQADSLFSASPVHGFVWRRSAADWNSFTYDYRVRKRRQDSPEDVIENGSIYVFRPEILRGTGNRLGGRIAVYPMHPLDSFQVDEPGDLELMGRLLAARRESPEPESFAGIRLLVLDFDGVMTDNRVLTDETGREAVWCSRSDGWGIVRLRETGVEVVVLSTEENPVVGARCRKLGIPCIQGSRDKLAALRALAASRSLEAAQIAYVGNDVNDLECLGWVGMPLAVADACSEVLERSRYATSRPGGRGAVREVCDWILSGRARPGPATHS